MLEKLAWMKRSAERIEKSLSCPDDVQDNFLSFTHASQLFYFYFSKWAKEVGKVESPKNLVKKYVASLSPSESEIWNCLQELRTEDVHTRPVKISNAERPEEMFLDGEQLFLDGEPLSLGEYRYEVHFGSRVFDVLSLCQIGLQAKAKFCDGFEHI